MSIFAIADLHLSFGLPNKTMEIFGPQWKNWTDKIKESWHQKITANDLVLIAGDISWALKIDEVLPDLNWIDALPGTKVMIKGNHDFWWGSLKKVQSILPHSLHVIQNNSFIWNECAIAGARLWDCSEYTFNNFIDGVSIDETTSTTDQEILTQQEKIFQREVERLKLSLKTIPKHIKTKIAMTHYPPIGANLNESTVSRILDDHQINYAIFGHLHNMKDGSLPFGKKNNVHYSLTSCDYLHFIPKKIF